MQEWRLCSRFTSPVYLPLPRRSELEISLWGPGPACQHPGYIILHRCLLNEQAIQGWKIHLYIYLFTKYSPGQSPQQNGCGIFLPCWIAWVRDPVLCSESPERSKVVFSSSFHFSMSNLRREAYHIIEQDTILNLASSSLASLSITAGHWHTKSLLSLVVPDHLVRLLHQPLF